MVDDEIDVVGGLAEIVPQRGGCGIEIEEPEIAVGFEARRRGQAEGGLVERFGIGVGARHGDELAVIAVAPAVIDAVEAARIAAALGADDGTAVAAGVEEATDRAFGVAAEDHRPGGDAAGFASSEAWPT